MGRIEGGYRGPDIVSNGLVLYLDAGSPNSYRTDFGTTWKDTSGNGNNGTLTNNPTFNSANQGSFFFNASNYIVCAHNSSLNLSNAITVIAWIKRTHNTGTMGFNGYKGIVDKGRDNYGAWSMSCDEYLADNLMNFRCRISGTNRALRANNTYTSNIWTQIVGTYNGTTLALYQNAQLDNSANYSGTIGTNSVGVYVGSSNDNLYFSGSIAQVSIYNVALSASEILQNYNAQKSRFGL
jgi:hypothetical protein